MCLASVRISLQRFTCWPVRCSWPFSYVALRDLTPAPVSARPNIAHCCHAVCPDMCGTGHVGSLAEGAVQAGGCMWIVATDLCNLPGYCESDRALFSTWTAELVELLVKLSCIWLSVCSSIIILFQAILKETYKNVSLNVLFHMYPPFMHTICEHINTVRTQQKKKILKREWEEVVLISSHHHFPLFHKTFLLIKLILPSVCYNF